MTRTICDCELPMWLFLFQSWLIVILSHICDKLKCLGEVGPTLFQVQKWFAKKMKLYLDAKKARIWQILCNVVRTSLRIPLSQCNCKTYCKNEQICQMSSICMFTQTHNWHRLNLKCVSLWSMTTGHVLACERVLVLLESAFYECILEKLSNFGIFVSCW